MTYLITSLWLDAHILVSNLYDNYSRHQKNEENVLIMGSSSSPKRDVFKDNLIFSLKIPLERSNECSCFFGKKPCSFQ